MFILGNIGVLVLPDGGIGNAYQAFDENGNLKDEAQQTSILQLGSNLATVTAKLNLPNKVEHFNDERSYPLPVSDFVCLYSRKGNEVY